MWSSTSTGRIRRIGVFHRGGDGRYTLDEDSVRGLSAFEVTKIVTAEDGSVLVIGSDGVIRYNPRGGGRTEPPFRAMVRLVRPFSGKALFGGDRAPEGQGVEVPWGQNSLNFEVAAPLLGNEEQTVYQYLLEGAEKNWTDWGKQAGASYGSLGPGAYRFRVKARNRDGRISEEGSFAFTVLAPWYRSNIAYGVYALLGLLMVAGARRGVIRHEQKKARQRTEQLEAEARVLEATVAERTDEIAAQKDRIQLLSDIGREITASLDLDTILFRLYERANQLLDASIFGVGLYRPERGVIE